MLHRKLPQRNDARDMTEGTREYHVSLSAAEFARGGRQLPETFQDSGSIEGGLMQKIAAADPESGFGALFLRKAIIYSHCNLIQSKKSQHFAFLFGYERALGGGKKVRAVSA